MEIKHPNYKTLNDFQIPTHSISPLPEFRERYSNFSCKNLANVALIKSIREDGIRRPIILTADKSIVFGNRRYAAARIIGLEYVPVKYLPIFWNSKRKGEAARQVEELNELGAEIFLWEAFNAMVEEAEEKAIYLGETWEEGVVNRLKEEEFEWID